MGQVDARERPLTSGQVFLTLQTSKAFFILQFPPRPHRCRHEPCAERSRSTAKDLRLPAQPSPQSKNPLPAHSTRSFSPDGFPV